MAVIFQDAFTEGSTTPLASHTPSPTGTAWAEVEDTAGTLVLEAAGGTGIARASGNASPSQRLLYTCTPAPTSADVDVEVTIAAIPGSNDTPAVLLARYQDTSNYYAAVCYAGGAATDKKIVKKVAGTFTLIASGDFGTTAADVLKFELRGTTLKLYQNGTERLSVVDSAITAAGAAGMGLGNASDVSTDGVVSGWSLDDFKVTEVAAAPPSSGGRLYSTAFRAEASKEAPEIYLALELGAPFNMKVGSRGVMSHARGNIEPRIEEWGSLRRAVDPLSHVLSEMELNCSLIDEDRVFARAYTKWRSTGRRATAVLRAMSPNVADVDSFVLLSGILQNASQDRAFHWTLTCKPDDGQLRNGKVPRLAISAYFPNAHDDVRGFFAPVMYGRFDSNGAGNKGLVPLYLVDRANSRYLLGQGYCNAVTAVYDTEGVVIGTSLYSVVRSNEKGALFTMVDFTADKEEPILYADAEGITVNPDGTGGYIANPADQFIHAARNYIWGDYRSGAYLTTSPVKSTAVDTLADYFDALSIKGGYYFGGENQISGMDLLNAFLESMGVYAFWTNGGEIVVKALDHRPPTDIYADPWVRGNADELGAFSTPSDASVIERGVTVSYTPDPARTGFKNTLRVVDKSVPEEIVGELQLPWSESKVV